MATTIVTKNSSTASAVPTAAQLVQGELAVNVADKRLYTENNAGAIVELGTNPSSLTVSGNIDVDGTTNLDVVDIDGAVDMASTLTVAGEITANGGIALGDNDKATFGAGVDLQIYSDGTNAIIKEDTGGSLYIGGADIHLMNPAFTEYYISAAQNGAVTLRHDNATKLATTATGIDVTGTATMDGLTVDGNGDVALAWASGSTHKVGSSFSTTYYTGMRVSADSRNTDIISLDASGIGNVNIFTGSTETKRVSVNPSGDISFYEDTGTTAKLFWDASAESLGIGTSSPSTSYSIDAVKGIRSSGAAPNFTLQETDTGNQTWLMASYGGSFAIRDTTVSGTSYPFKIEAATPNNTLYLDSAGRVGIGASSPSAVIDVVSSGTNSQSIAKFSSASGKRAEISTDAQDDAFMYLYDSADAVKVAFRTDGNASYINGGGNLGIGTSSVVDKLQVQDSSSGSSPVLFSLVNDTGGPAISTGVKLWMSGRAASTTNRGAYLEAVTTNTNNAHDLLFATSSSGTAPAERLRIDSSGNVGIGTSSPETPLHVNSTGAGYVNALQLKRTNGTDSAYLRVGVDADANLVRYISSGSVGGSHAFNVTNLSEAMRIDSSGRVGIGTSTPSAELEVSGGTQGVVITQSDGGRNLGYYAQIKAPYAEQSFEINVNNNKLITAGGYMNATSLMFHTANTERMRIDSSGNLLIGTSTAGASKLVVNDDSIQVNTAKTPASASATGTTGEIAWDANYVYVCVATNTWKRSALSTW